MDTEMTAATQRMAPSVHVPSAHYATFDAVPCNFARRFPLYEVEADGLRANTVQPKEANLRLKN